MTSAIVAERPTEGPPVPERRTPRATLAPSRPPRHLVPRQATWQRVLLLIVLGYEAFGGLSGGGLLAAAPDGHLMDMPVEMMKGFFPNFFIPGLMLVGLGALNTAAFVGVWRRTRIDWLVAGLGLGGLTVWFLVEIAVLGGVHWLHLMWGLPVVLGIVMALPLIPSRAEGTPFIQAHPVLTYAVLTFLVSWGGLVLVTAGTGIVVTAEEFARRQAEVVLITVAGPAVAGILMTGLVAGWSGYRDLLARLVHWRVSARWYAVALLTGPLAVAATVLALWPISPVFRPGVLATDDVASLLVANCLYGLAGGFLEELGWTGWAIPRLLRRRSVMATGLVVGVLWGVWHLPSNVYGSGDEAGALSLGLLLPVLVYAFAVLPAFRVLMVWVYSQTQSLLVAMLMHGMLIWGWLTAMPVGITGAPFVAWYLAVAAALWGVVALVRGAANRTFARQPA